MRSRGSGRRLAMLLGLVTLFTVSVVIVPVLLLRPFSPQTPAMVATAYALRTVSPWLAPSGFALSAVLGAFYLRATPLWSGSGWWTDGRCASVCSGSTTRTSS